MIVTSVPTQQQKFKTWMYVAGENWKVTLLFEHPSYTMYQRVLLLEISLSKSTSAHVTLDLRELLVHWLQDVRASRFVSPKAKSIFNFNEGESYTKEVFPYTVDSLATNVTNENGRQILLALLFVSFTLHLITSLPLHSSRYALSLLMVVTNER